MELNFIKIPLYKLNYISDLGEINLDQHFLDQFRNEYEIDERKSIFKQLDWAVNNPDYNFKTLVSSDRFSNQEIYSYILKLHRFMLDNNEF